MHAQQVGGIFTGLEGYPSWRIATLEETEKHELKTVLTESLNPERQSLELDKGLLDVVENASIYLEKFTLRDERSRRVA